MANAPFKSLSSIFGKEKNCTPILLSKGAAKSFEEDKRPAAESTAVAVTKFLLFIGQVFGDGYGSYVYL